MKLAGVSGAVASAALVSCFSCFTSCQLLGPVVEYGDSLRNSKDRTVGVRYTAKLGGVFGVLAGIPADIVLLPITYPVHLYRDSMEPESTSMVDSLLFPSLALLQVGSMIAIPIDVLEFGLYRVWLPRDTMTAEEKEELERRLDDETLPRYPVTPVWPAKRS